MNVSAVMSSDVKSKYATRAAKRALTQTKVPGILCGPLSGDCLLSYNYHTMRSTLD